MLAGFLVKLEDCSMFGNNGTSVNCRRWKNFYRSPLAVPLAEGSTEASAESHLLVEHLTLGMGPVVMVDSQYKI